MLESFIELKNPTCVNLPITFAEISKQIIWGNRFIKIKGKSLIFINWIESGIVMLDDIFKEGKISETFILGKLKSKSNWISEINRLKKAIPTVWKQSLNSHHSITQ